MQVTPHPSGADSGPRRKQADHLHPRLRSESPGSEVHRSRRDPEGYRKACLRQILRSCRRGCRPGRALRLLGQASGQLSAPKRQRKAEPTETPENIEAARQATFTADADSWIFTHQWLLDPIILGQFPDCSGTRLEPLVQKVTQTQLEIIHCPPDMLGYNIYNGHAVCAGESGPVYLPKYPGYPRTALKWPVTPEVLDWGVRFLQERYGLPGYITENGSRRIPSTGTGR